MMHTLCRLSRSSALHLPLLAELARAHCHHHRYHTAYQGDGYEVWSRRAVKNHKDEMNNERVFSRVAGNLAKFIHSLKWSTIFRMMRQGLLLDPTISELTLVSSTTRHPPRSSSFKRWSALSDIASFTFPIFDQCSCTFLFYSLFSLSRLHLRQYKYICVHLLLTHKKKLSVITYLLCKFMVNISSSVRDEEQWANQRVKRGQD